MNDRSFPGKTAALRRGLLAGMALVASATAPAASVPAAAGSAAADAATPEIVVLSNIRPDLVSGGDALVEVKLPAGTRPDTVTVTLNGRDITDRFAARAGGRYMGLVTGLADGRNALVAGIRGGTSARLALTNHPLQGPIFSGPRVEPYVCDTQSLGLAASTPPTCEAPTTFAYFYKPAGSKAFDVFIPYDPASPPPKSKVAVTTTDQGKTVPFIVRRERGVIDRAIYDIVVLYQPGQDWTPWAPQGAWNGKLFVAFTGGTKAWHKQSILGGMGAGVMATESGYNPFTVGDLPLSRGFAVATTTQSQINNQIASAEATMMLKEHFIETYGPVRYTMAIGSSGGSMMQHLTAQNQPGLLDGLIPLLGLPDMWTIMADVASDYPLLGHYFSTATPGLWPDKAARTAVYGGIDGGEIPLVQSGATSHFFQPDIYCTVEPKDVFSVASMKEAAALEPKWAYDPVRNPTGSRCAIQDSTEKNFGTRPRSAWGPVERKIGRGFASRPVDNIGLQYGLAALKRGEITAAQFVDLNEKIGGFDIDAVWTAGRMEVDPAALRNLYRTGQINEGLNLGDVPLIHVHVAPLGAYDVYHPPLGTEMVRRRLIAANGTAGNLVHYVSADGLTDTGTDTSIKMKEQAFLTLDRWLTAIEADRGAGTRAAKVLRDKPADAKDGCWANGKPGAACPTPYVYPRMVAGGPVASDIQKCQLRPIAWSDYGKVRFTPDQQQRLRAAFPKGVCDWSKPSVGYQRPAAWATYDGTPMGPAPRSIPAAATQPSRN